MSKFAGLELAVDQPSRMVIRHPATKEALKTADGQEGYIDLLSDDSAAALAYDDRINGVRLERKQRDGIAVTMPDLRKEQVGRLVALTVGWRLVSYTDGAFIDVPFSPDAARELYGASSLAWLREQAEAHIASRRNFIAASSSS